MNVSFIKQMEDLEREVLLKSVDLDDDSDDFQFELWNQSVKRSRYPFTKRFHPMNFDFPNFLA